MWARMLTAKQARREVEPLIEHLGEVTEWPQWTCSMALEPTFAVKMRYTFTLFLLGNRVPPIVIAEFMVLKLRDRTACLDVAALLRKYWQCHPSIVTRAPKYWDVLLEMNLPLALAPATVTDKEFWAPASGRRRRRCGEARTRRPRREHSRQTEAPARGMRRTAHRAAWAMDVCAFRNASWEK